MLGLTTSSRLPFPPANHQLMIPNNLASFNFTTRRWRRGRRSSSLLLAYGQAKANGGGVDENKGEGGRPKLNMRWLDLVLDPDPNNLVAVALTGLLTWASVQVLCQLFLISLAILVAALKYSFIAALLIFILITLL